jgi:hypothetical protein
MDRIKFHKYSCDGISSEKHGARPLHDLDIPSSRHVERRWGSNRQHDRLGCRQRSGMELRRLLSALHFTLVLACIGAGVAASAAIRHAIHHDRSSANARIIAGGLGLGLVSGLVGGVLANEFSAALFGREYAIAAWGITGGTLGLTLAVWFEDLDPLPASSGGLCAGLLSGWLLFDPFANIIEIAMEAAGLGFSLGIAITVADSVLGNHSLPIASRLHDGG